MTFWQKYNLKIAWALVGTLVVSSLGVASLLYKPQVAKAANTPTFVRSTVCAYSGGGSTYSCTVNASTGDMLFLINGNSNTDYVSAISDTNGNSWNLAATSTLSLYSTVSAYYALNITGGTFTINATSTGSIQWYPIVAEFSNVASVSALISAQTGTGTTNPITSGNFSSLPAGTLVVAGAENYYGTGTWSAGNPSGMAIPSNGIANHNSDGTSNAALEYSVLGSTYSSSATMSWSGTVYGSLVAAAFTPSNNTYCGNGYLYCQQIEIDHNKVGGGTEDETYFPWEASSTDASIATSGNGGYVQNTTTETGSSYTGTVPADLIFTSDSSCGTKLNWEFESYNSATGNFIAWIANSSTAVSHTSNTIVWMCFDNSSVTTWQGNVSGTWNSNYVGVWHFPSNAGTLSENDSTSNGYNGSMGTWALSPTPIIDGSASTTSGNGSTYMQFHSNMLSSNALTVSCWVWTYPGLGGGNTSIFGLGVSNSDEVRLEVGTSAQLFAGAYNSKFSTSNSLVPTNGWFMAAISFNSSTGIIYYNGVNEASGSNGLSTYTSTPYIGYTDGFHGMIDECEMSNVARSAGWISTEYNNQSAPDKANYGTGGFYIIGPLQAGSGGGGATPVKSNALNINYGAVDINKGSVNIGQ